MKKQLIRGGKMSGQPSPRVVGRLAGLLLVGSGALTAISVALPQQPGFDSLLVLSVALCAVGIGGAGYVLPWQRWNVRWTLVMLPIAFALIAAGNYYGNAQPYTYSTFFVVAFVWVGLGHPRWTSLWFLIPAGFFYAVPLALDQGQGSAAFSSTLVVIPVCGFVAEAIAWMADRERRSRDRTMALARVAEALGPHLNVNAIGQTLAQEVRVALHAEDGIFVQINDGVAVKVHTDGHDPGVGRLLRALEGQSLSDQPQMDKLSAGEHVIVVDTGTASQVIRRAESYAVRSYLAMPVLVDSKLVGLLGCAERSRKRRFDQDDVALAKAMASYASTALQNAILYETTLEASRSDALTGLGNRRSFHERLAHEVDRARRYGRSLSLVVADADRLKQVNDAWGHLAGDRILKTFARLLQHGARKEDGIFRLGGDEFALILPETGPAGASIVAERLRKRIQRAHFGENEELELTASIGVSGFPEHGTNPDELFERADTALYEAKGSGGDAVAMATAADAGGPGVRFGVDIQAVIDRQLLLPLYQPIVHLPTGAVLGYEGLSRLDAAFGSAPTTTLFRAAGVLGLAHEFDRLCRSIVLGAAHGLSDAENLFLNVSPAALGSEEWDVRLLLATIAEAGLATEQVVVEVTGQGRASVSDLLVGNLEACRTAGLGLALDDFGTSAVDLDLVARVRFDYVKVDMSFVQGADTAEARQRQLRGLFVVAKESGASVIAEGVETIEDLSLVKELGFEAAQGYLLKDPSPTIDPPRGLEILRSV